jgi:hypothetical protein
MSSPPSTAASAASDTYASYSFFFRGLLRVSLAWLRTAAASGAWGWAHLSGWTSRDSLK